MHKKDETKKLVLNKTIVTKLQQNLTDEQLKAVAGGRVQVELGSRTNANC